MNSLVLPELRNVFETSPFTSCFSRSPPKAFLGKFVGAGEACLREALVSFLQEFGNKKEERSSIATKDLASKKKNLKSLHHPRTPLAAASITPLAKR